MPKDVKGAAPSQTPQSSMFSLLSGWVQQGVESAFATQRILVDLAIRQSAKAMKELRERLTDKEYSPATIMTEMAVEGMANFIEAQRILLTLVQEQSAIATNGVKERVGKFAPAAAMTDLVRKSIDVFVDAQQDFLTIVNKQSQKWIQASGAKMFDTSHVTDLAKDAMENFVSAQKKFLDVIAEQTEKAISGKYDKPMKTTEVNKLVRDSANSFIDAQKKLLDIASQQMNVNLQAATKAMKAISPARLLPLASLTGEGVKDLVNAEKAVMDTVLKPRAKTAKGKAPKRKAAAKAAVA